MERSGKFFTYLLYGAAAVGLIWLSVRYLLPWTAPFIAAFITAAVMEAPVRFLSSHGWRRTAASAFTTLFGVALIIFAVFALSAKAIDLLSHLGRELPGLMEKLSNTLNELEEAALTRSSGLPEGVSGYIKTAIDSITESLYSLPGQFSRLLIEALTRMARSAPDTALFIVTYAIGTYFISASFPRMLSFIMAQLPPGVQSRLGMISADLRGSFGGWMRAQFILMVITFFELVAAFLFLKVKGAFLIALITAFIDALPVFGVGVVLVPWAIYALLSGEIGLGIGLIISWGIISLVRNCVQAKLLGDQIGLDPIASLLAMYVGWRCWGVWGMLFFPLLFVTVIRLNDRGVVRLWKSA